MTVPPLCDHLDTEDEDQLRRDMSAPLDAGFEAGDGPGVDDDARPAGAHPRLWAWLHVEPFYWTMRVVYVCLAAGAVFAVYINGVAEGWWHAWGEKPSVAATLIHPDGAGLRKRPTRTPYTNKYIPTLVSVTNPTQTHTVTLFVREVTVTFKATNYE